MIAELPQIWGMGDEDSTLATKTAVKLFVLETHRHRNLRRLRRSAGVSWTYFKVENDEDEKESVSLAHESA